MLQEQNSLPRTVVEAGKPVVLKKFKNALE